MKELSKEQMLELLDNYRTWASDDPPDYAEVYYYVACPDFVDTIKWGSKPAYDDRQAWLVEEVLRVMFESDPQGYGVIKRFYGEGKSRESVGKWLGVSGRHVSRVYLPAAQDSFAREWANFFLDASRKPWA